MTSTDLPTSALLRQAEHDRDQAVTAAHDWSQRFQRAAQARDLALAELASARAETETLRAERARIAAQWRSLLEELGIDPATVETPVMQAKRIGRLAAEVPTLKAQLAEATRYGWQVEQRGDTACARGGHTIPIGHAVQPMPGAKGYFECVICPVEEHA